ncbi:MAG: flagellar export chaperone FliS [Nitrospiria bacterium]
MNNSYVQEYSKVGMETGVASADPHRLILMLLEGAITSIAFAKHEIQRGNRGAKGEAISKAISIIGELDSSLDMEAGGALSENLRGLYEYMSLQLVEANLQNDEKILDRITSLLGELKTGWAGIEHEVKQTFSEKVVSYGTV